MTICHATRDALVVNHKSDQGIGCPIKNAFKYVCADEAESIGLLTKHHSSGKVSLSMMQKCYEFLKPRATRVNRRMVVEGSLASEQETHQEWCKLLCEQGVWLQDPPESKMEWIAEQLQHLQEAANKSIGSGHADTEIMEQDVSSLVSDMKDSDAIPPDLLPRAMLQSEDRLSGECIWRLLRICGPCKLAVRPNLWRWASAVPLHKNGNPQHIPNYRLIMIKQQMGLLQETLLSQRLEPKVRSALTSGQSGYVRDVEDPIVLLHEICALRLAINLPTWTLMGDFKKAFPKVWREDLLVKMGIHGLVKDCAFALLCDVLHRDFILVPMSGTSLVDIQRGIPEGGTIGTLLYTSLPDDLVKTLIARGDGIGLDVSVPTI